MKRYALGPSLPCIKNTLLTATTAILLSACGSGGDQLPPLEAIGSATTLNEDSVTTGSVSAEHIDGSVEYIITSYPNFGTLDLQPSGQFTYTPNVNFNGSDSFSFYAQDDRGASEAAEVILSVAPVNDAPIAPDHVADVYGTEVLSLQLNASDVDGDSLSYSIISAPINGSANISNDGELTYEPSSPSNGQYIITYVANDPGGLSTEGTITLEANGLPARFKEEYIQLQVEKNNQLTGSLTVENLSSESLTLPLDSSPRWLYIDENITIDANSSIDIPFIIDTVDLNTGLEIGMVTYGSEDQHDGDISTIFSLGVTADTTPPAAITDLSVEPGEMYNMATINWTAQNDNSRDQIRADQFELRYSTSEITEQNWNEAALVTGLPTPLFTGSQQQYVFNGLNESRTYHFAIRAVDAAGNKSAISNNSSITTPAGPTPLIEPGSISAEIAEGQIETFPLTLTNTGGSPLAYSASIESASTQTPTKILSGKKISKKVAMPKTTAEMISDSNGNIIVKTRSNSGATLAVNSALTSQGLSISSAIDKLNIKVVTAQQKSAQEIADTINQLNSMPEVLYAEPDYTVHAMSVPNDYFFNQQWALNNEGQTNGNFDSDIDALEAWTEYTSGSNTVVAVIDSGVQHDHEDLASNMWINSDEIPNNGLDDDNNGFIDDIYGYDFVNNDGNPMDDNDHGTHCAGIIGADTNNGLGMAGTVHNTQIMALKFLNSGGSGSTSAAIDSIIYAVDNGADILNNSWGGGLYSQALYDAIEYAKEQDVLFVAAAGNETNNNDTNPSYPGSYDLDNIISVASTTDTDGISYFSNYGSNSVDLGAPGSDILSTVSGGGYELMSGTSMAAPYVTGAAVMLHSFDPTLSALDIKEILLTTTDPISSLQGKTLTNGRLNLQSALSLAASRNFITITDNQSGVVPAGESVAVTVTIDTINKEAKLYEKLVSFELNSPSTPEASAAVSITVTKDGTPPADINDLSIESTTESEAILSWTNTGDDGFSGNADKIQIAYSTESINNENWENARIISDIPAMSGGSSQQHTVSELTPNTLYYFAVKSIDSSGEKSGISNTASQQTLAGASIELTPATLEPLTIPVNTTGNQTIEIANSGDMTLTYALEIVDPVDASTTKKVLKKEDKSINIAKGDFDYRQGQPTTQASGGPDVFGYTWADSHGDASYDWQDISGVGESLTFSDDSVRGPIDLGFSFPFYGNEYSQIWVSSNGFLSFDPNINNGCCSGEPIPSADQYNNLIAWAWDDLYPSDGYSVHYLVESDKVTFQFTNYGEFAFDGLVTAQVILNEDGSIKFQYKDFKNDFAKDEVSVGIENEDGSDGLQVVFNADYLQDQMAIEFTPPIIWLELSQSEGEIEAFSGESNTILLNYDSSDLSAGSYESNLHINHNDPLKDEIVIPIRLDVTE